MTTAQESPNGHSLFPPPCSVPDLQCEDGSEDSTRNNAISEPSALGSDQLPERCQFTFSDGRQCTMARSDIHPSLCRFHAEREDQLFGTPGTLVVGAALDLPELHSACRDLTTASGVNRALSQVFRLLAQRRISRQEAATFGHLAQLLLRTVSLMRQENLTIPVGSSGSAAKSYPSAGESHGHQELSSVHKVALSPLNKVTAALGDASRADAANDVILSESALSSRERLPTGCAFAAQQSRERSAHFASRTVLRETSPQLSPQHDASGPQPTSTTVDPSAPPMPPAVSSEPSAARAALKSSLAMNTSAAFVSNSRGINTSEGNNIVDESK